MDNNNKSKILVSLFLFTIGVMTLPMLSSCGKNGNINPVEAKIEYQVLNLSYDVLPVNLYVSSGNDGSFLRQNTTPFNYPSASGYFGLTTIDTPFYIRSASTATVTNLLKIDSANLKRKTKYSLFIVGSRKANTLSYIFTTDTSTRSRIGRGKVRFVNASPEVEGVEGGLDLTANDSVVVARLRYKQVSDFIEMSAGSYNFKIRPSRKPSTTLADLNRTTIEDGRLYTIYTYGLAFKTDTTAFGVGILTNR